MRRWFRKSGPGRPPAAQRFLPFHESRRRRDRAFKRGIAAVTALAVTGLVAGTPSGRFAAGSAVLWTKQAAFGLLGAPRDRGWVMDEWRLKRGRSLRQANEALRSAYDDAEPGMKRLLEVAGMAPDNSLMRPGNYHGTLLLSSKVFEADDGGRSYRLRPNTRSVWLRQISLKNGVLCMFLVPDTPETRRAGERAGGVVVEGSEQTTNSWGLRGPEPDAGADVRVMVLGDSFMQGMFVGDDVTPPALLERDLTKRLGRKAAVLNTGHLGYSPEQYYHALIEYYPRFKPRAVVVSLFANDFGDINDALKGVGDWDEGNYWLGEIGQFCRTQGVTCLAVPIPCEFQLTARRREGHYPGMISNHTDFDSTHYLYPIEAFVNENLRLVREGAAKGQRPQNSPLFNGHIADGHFSPAGSALWARLVGERLALLLPARPAAVADRRGGGVRATDQP